MTTTTKTAACANCGRGDELRAIYPVDEQQNIKVEIDDEGKVSYDYTGCTNSLDGVGDDEGFNCGNCGNYAETIEGLLGLPERTDLPYTPAQALAKIAAGVPQKDTWRSAADFMEYVAEILDKAQIARPDCYDDCEQHG
jgi:hypothetical protein